RPRAPRPGPSQPSHWHRPYPYWSWTAPRPAPSPPVSRHDRPSAHPPCASPVWVEHQPAEVGKQREFRDPASFLQILEPIKHQPFLGNPASINSVKTGYQQQNNNDKNPDPAKTAARVGIQAQIRTGQTRTGMIARYGLGRSGITDLSFQHDQHSRYVGLQKTRVVTHHAAQWLTTGQLVPLLSLQGL